jgi:hypothetical protein
MSTKKPDDSGLRSAGTGEKGTRSDTGASKQSFRVIMEVTFSNPPRSVTIEDVDAILRQRSEYECGELVCDPQAIEQVFLEAPDAHSPAPTDSSGTEPTNNRGLEEAIYRLTERVDQLSNWYHAHRQYTLECFEVSNQRIKRIEDRQTVPLIPTVEQISVKHGPPVPTSDAWPSAPVVSRMAPALGGSGNEPAAPFADSSGTEQPQKDQDRSYEDV